MPVHGVQLPGDEFGVVLGDVARPGLLAELQAGVHLRTEGVERIDRLPGVGDDGLVLGLHLGQEVPFDLRIERELDHLGVDHHELQLRGMLAVEQRGDDGVQTHRLALSGGTRDEQVGHLREVEDVVFVLDRAPDDHRKLGLRLLEAQRPHGRIHRHDLLVAVRNLDADRPAAGDRRDDADARLGLEALGDVVLQPLDLGDLHALGLHDLVERDGRADGGLDALDGNAEVLERLLDAGLVLEDLLVGDLRIGDVVLEQRHGRLAVIDQILQRIVALGRNGTRIDDLRLVRLDRYHNPLGGRFTRCGLRSVGRRGGLFCRGGRFGKPGGFGSFGGFGRFGAHRDLGKRAVGHLAEPRGLRLRALRTRRDRRTLQFDQPPAAHDHPALGMREIDLREDFVVARPARSRTCGGLPAFGHDTRPDGLSVGRKLEERVLLLVPVERRFDRLRRGRSLRRPLDLKGRRLRSRSFGLLRPHLRRSRRSRRNSRRGSHGSRRCRGLRGLPFGKILPLGRRFVLLRVRVGLPVARPGAVVRDLAAHDVHKPSAAIHHDVSGLVDLVDEIPVDEDAREDPAAGEQDNRSEGPDVDPQQLADGNSERPAPARRATEAPAVGEGETQGQRPEDHDEEQREDRVVHQQRPLADDPHADQDEHHGDQDAEEPERVVDEQARQTRPAPAAEVFGLHAERGALLGGELQPALVGGPAEEGKKHRKSGEQADAEQQQSGDPAHAVAVRALHGLARIAGCISGSHFLRVE